MPQNTRTIEFTEHTVNSSGARFAAHLYIKVILVHLFSKHELLSIFRDVHTSVMVRGDGMSCSMK